MDGITRISSSSLKAYFSLPRKADVFFVDIEVDEAADLAVFAAQVLAQRGNLFSISVTSSGRLAAVDDYLAYIVVCFWNAFGNRTLTDITFSQLP